MERIPLSEAQARVAANTGSDSLVDPATIDWTEPAREAVTIAGLVQSATDDLAVRNRTWAVALALCGYQAFLDFEAGKRVAIHRIAGELSEEALHLQEGCAGMSEQAQVRAFEEASVLADASERLQTTGSVLTRKGG